MTYLLGIHKTICAKQLNICFHLGVNMPDHDVMFSNMMTLIHERVTPHVAVLKSKDCPNIKSIMAKAIQQFMENVDVV